MQFGFLSLWLRQTNVVWVAFAAAYAISHLVPDRVKWSREFMESLCRRSLNALPWLAVGIMFCVFVLWNGSIVLGDKQHHAAVFHVAQPCYVLGVLAVYLIGEFSMLSVARYFDAPAALDMEKWKEGVRWCFGVTWGPGSCLMMLLVTFLLAVLLHQFSYDHPFLFADNRHYTFYIWNRLLGRFPILRSALSAVYMLGLCALASRVAAYSQVMARRFITLWLACTAAALIPAQLIEPRYLVIPIFLALIHVRFASRTVLVTVLVFHTICDAATIYIFVSKPFKAPDGTVGRFMW
jgi:alpha-1,2-glucosyltransferase